VVDFESLFDSNYLRWFHLPEKGLLIEIRRIDAKVEMQLPGKAEKQYKPVVHYIVKGGEVEKPLPFIMNKSNGKLIAAIHGRDASKWIGKEVVLVRDKTRLGKEIKDCIRVRSKK
jgi:hypothetical protein